MKKLNIWKNLCEAIKEPLRLLVLAALPVLIVYLRDFPYSWAVIATLVLRLADKLLHELGKETKDENTKDLLLKGLTRF